MNPWAAAMIGLKNVGQDSYRPIRRAEYETCLEMYPGVIPDSQVERMLTDPDNFPINVIADVFESSDDINNFLLANLPSKGTRPFDRAWLVRIRRFADTAPLLTATKEWRECAAIDSKRTKAAGQRVEKIARRIVGRGGHTDWFIVSWR